MLQTSRDPLARLGALEWRSAPEGHADSLLEAAAGLHEAPSMHPPYCELRTAMITTSADDAALEASGGYRHAGPSNLPLESHATYYSPCNSVVRQ